MKRLRPLWLVGFGALLALATIDSRSVHLLGALLAGLGLCMILIDATKGW